MTHILLITVSRNSIPMYCVSCLLQYGHCLWSRSHSYARVFSPLFCLRNCLDQSCLSKTVEWFSLLSFPAMTLWLTAMIADREKPTPVLSLPSFATFEKNRCSYSLPYRVRLQWHRLSSSIQPTLQWHLQALLQLWRLLWESAIIRDYRRYPGMDGAVFGYSDGDWCEWEPRLWFVQLSVSMVLADPYASYVYADLGLERMRVQKLFAHFETIHQIQGVVH